MKSVTLAATCLAVAISFAGQAIAQEASQAEKDLCNEAVKDITGDEVPAKAQDLCEAGDLEGAIKAAMTARK